MMTTATYELIQVERRGAVALATLNNPPANSLSRKLVDELRQLQQDVAADDGVRCLVLTGAGEKFFVAGADIKELAGGAGKDVADQVGERSAVFTGFETLDKPVVVAINGFALGGGCELAMAADIRIAADTAKFGQPEINIGIIPGWGGTQRLPRLVGRTLAMDLLLTGRMMGADEALRAGLVNQVVPAAELIDAALAYAGKLAGQAPIGIAATKRAVFDGMSLPIEEALQVERREFARARASEDAQEGLSAFVEKRTPTWKGR
ncbi:MAG: enoyl-CoA hydratase/isomerase family protein [Candidatus Dormibacteria bacterium]